MSRAEISPGVCGFFTVVEVASEGRLCRVSLQSECKAIQKIAEELDLVDPLKELSARRGMPRCLDLGIKHCFHAACPVPAGIIKALEVEKKLALPVNVSIKLE